METGQATADRRAIFRLDWPDVFSATLSFSRSLMRSLADALLCKTSGCSAARTNRFLAFHQKQTLGPYRRYWLKNRFPDPMELPGAKSCRIFRRQKGEFTGWYGNASFSAHGSSDGFPHRRRPA
ncbi:hypothetical protein HF283_05025 [Acidithiobacillus ferrooxidans]|jgi:hypothetical protein|nr:hypothetical protein [Acidithiobacillus ferrooxidans]